MWWMTAVDDELADNIGSGNRRWRCTTAVVYESADNDVGSYG